MGRSWEIMIRSVCSILRQSSGEQLVEDETLLTLMCETDKMLNDRPLTKLDDDPTGFGALNSHRFAVEKEKPRCGTT
jgi:hypothetical protein